MEIRPYTPDQAHLPATLTTLWKQTTGSATMVRGLLNMAQMPHQLVIVEHNQLARRTRGLGVVMQKPQAPHSIKRRSRQRRRRSTSKDWMSWNSRPQRCRRKPPSAAKFEKFWTFPLRLLQHKGVAPRQRPQSGSLLKVLLNQVILRRPGKNLIVS